MNDKTRAEFRRFYGTKSKRVEDLAMKILDVSDAHWISWFDDDPAGTIHGSRAVALAKKIVKGGYK